MADWYCSSAAYALIPVWQATHAYSVGDIIKPTAPAALAKYAFRCTTAGTSGGSEPTWGITNNGTTTSGTAVFTHVTGQSAYGWSAAAGDGGTLVKTSNSRVLAGDRLFLSSDHSETISVTATYGIVQTGGLTPGAEFLSVNRAGSVPPVTADLQAGATCISTTQLLFGGLAPIYHYGITYEVTGTSGFSTSGQTTSCRPAFFDTCTFYLNTASSVFFEGSSSQSFVDDKYTLLNCVIQFGAAGQGIAGYGNMEFIGVSLAGTAPTSLFTMGSSNLDIICRGCDFSLVTGNLLTITSGNYGSRILLDSCKIASGVTRLNQSAVANTLDVLELINCYDGTNILNERYQVAGMLTTERTVTRSGGATDDVGSLSFKISTGTNCDKFAPFVTFWFDVENILTAGSHIAAVEIISDGGFNTDEVWLELEYQGTSGSPVATIVNSKPATILTSAAAIATSPAGWNSSPVPALNPLDQLLCTLSNSNMTATFSGTGGVRAGAWITASKYYFEFTMTTWSGAGVGLGMGLGSVSFSGSTTNQALCTRTSGIFINGSFSGVTLGTLTSGTVIGVAVDVGTDLAWFRVAPSGNWNASGTANPATGVGGLNISALTGDLYPIINGASNGDVVTVNFGATSYTGTAPSGFGNVGATAVLQRLQVPFTPQKAGRVRGRVMVGKSAVVYVDPIITIT